MPNIFIQAIAIKNNSPQEGFPFAIPAIKKLNLRFRKPITFLVGENGSGKSTLLEAIAERCGFDAMGGNKQHKFSADEYSPLASHLYIERNPMLRIDQGFFFRAESFFNLSAYIDENGNPKYWGGRELLKQSHGESFLAAFNSRFREGLFLMDEPEAALSPQRQLSLMAIINGMEREGKSQLIIATHSPILLAYPNADIFFLDENGIAKVSYEETEHYRITKSFLDNPGLYFRALFGE
ncbi:MAG: AAA family ATPase [Bacteroidales bacterium]|nr:AAA family ATPase [Bacteroidales bacterium]